MSNLDINTPRGQETLHDELEMAALFEEHRPGFSYVMTDKTGTATVDAIIVRLYNKAIIGVAEAKCRKMTLDTFRGPFKSEWLVTAEKVRGGAAIAKALGVPLWGFCYLVPSRILLTQRLFDPASGWLARIEERRTKTQATVNGGTAWRLNAYIDMRSATMITEEGNLMGQVSRTLRRAGDRYFHWCPACESMHPLPDKGWEFNGDLDNPTFSPSFKQGFVRWSGGVDPVTGLGLGEADMVVCHYFITNGGIQFCPDSWHKRSDIVGMPPIPEHLRDG
jgi:hypothetical protein